MSKSYKDRVSFNFHAPTKIIFGENSLRSNIRRVTDPREIVSVLMAAW
jgi:alcohol dehydrogenase YqhD (iron-dependent ADH family)